MSFVKINILNTNFYDRISKIDIEARRIPDKGRETTSDWPCAYDSDRDIIFTQLISNTHEMRDWDYYYLMLVNDNPVFIYWTLERASLLDKGAAKQYDQNFLVNLINEASIVCTVRNEPLFKSTNA